MQLPQVGRVASAIEQLSTRLQPVDQERVPNALAAGRVLAEDLIADRPSPALDVSAMDGYALRLQDELPATLPVQSTAPAGSAPQTLHPGHAIRIFTGAVVPTGADCVECARGYDRTSRPSAAHHSHRRNEAWSEYSQARRKFFTGGQVTLTRFHCRSG
ncbi:MAG: hypothetical protein R3C56_04605 [Pirellulaceae bacterium]